MDKLKRLYLMRHSKTEPGGETKDFLRKLTDRGRRDAAAAGRNLAEMAPPPLCIICSPALRARETAELVALELKRFSQQDGADQELEPIIRDELYTATAEEYLSLITREGKGDSLLLVAHNPSMEQLAAHFEGSSAGMATSEVAWFDFSVDSWRKLGAENRPLNGGRIRKQS